MIKKLNFVADEQFKPTLLASIIVDFDLEKCLEETKENPVFYIQYALARINSVEKLSLKNSIKIENYNEQIFEAFREEELNFNDY